MSVQEPRSLTFEGFARTDGRIGVRNRVLVLPSVICSHVVAEEIAEQVESAVATPHDHGCAQIGADNDQTKRTFVGVGTNPNIAGVLVVGLGCEAVQSREVAEALAERGVAVRETAIQDVGGTDRCIEQGIEAVQELVDADMMSRTSAKSGDLTLGVVASDCDATTLDIADPLIGEAVSEVVGGGGRVLVAGTERMLSHANALRSRMETDVTRRKFDALANRHRDAPSRATRVYHDAGGVPPQIVRQLWADLPIEDVLAYGEQPSFESGVGLIDAPSRFAEAATGLAAAGAQLIVHVTSEGVPTGHPVVPTIKVTGDEGTATALSHDIDTDARTTDGEELIGLIERVAGGEPTCSERHELTEFAITRVGPSM